MKEEGKHMRKGITKKLLDGLEPAAKPFEIRDTAIKGFLIRVQPSGSAGYYVEVARGVRVALGSVGAITLERARHLAQQAHVYANEGKPLDEIRTLVRPDRQLAKKSKPDSADAITLKTFLNEQYEDWLQQNLKAGAEEAARLRSAFQSLSDIPLAEITAWQVEKWRAARLRAGKKPSACNRDLNSLKAALRRAVEWGILDTYPLAKVKPSKVDNSAVVRFLSPEEETRLRAALAARDAKIRTGRESGNRWREERGVELLPVLDGQYADHLMPAVLISLNSGMRRGEQLALEWKDIDLEGRMLTVHGSGAKSGKTRHIPMSDEAFSVFKAWRKQVAHAPTDPVFPSARTGSQLTSVKKSWLALLEAAQIEGFRWHDLRHTFASKLVQAGVDLNAVRELLGHATLLMTLRYAHLAPSHLHEAMKAMKPARAPAKLRGV